LRKHIAPRLGDVPIGKLSTAMIREWRASLLAGGVSVSVAAKAYRLLRAVLMTAVDEDKILPRNPCRIRGAGDENAAERPVLTVAQAFELAERVGLRPVGNIRKLPAAATGSGSAVTGKCARHPRSMTRGQRQSEHSGNWLAKAAQTASRMGASAPWFCSPPSRACAGVR
jgi:hypothetical protein